MAETTAQPWSVVRAVSRPHDAQEREADRAADTVARGGTVAGWSFSSVAPSAAVQRQESAQPKTEDEKYKDAGEAVGKAVLKTPQGKALKKRILADPVVKPVVDAVTSTPGLIAAGAVLAGGVGALAATGKELPVQLPEIPLDKFRPGMSATVVWKGPVNAPTSGGLMLTFTEQGPKKKSGGPTSSEAYRAETARMRAEQERFGRAAGAPGSKEAEEKRLSDEAIDYVVAQQSGRFGLTIPLTPPAKEKKDEGQTLVQPAAASDSVDVPAYVDVDDALASPGRPIDGPTRLAMEARFGYDFAAVRVHDDARAARGADDIRAAAFTVGRDVVFGGGQYAPSTAQGRELLAHELAHTIQQRGAQIEAPPVGSSSVLEAEAESAGRAARGRNEVAQSFSSSGLALARQPKRVGERVDEEANDEEIVPTDIVDDYPIHPGSKNELKRRIQSEDISVGDQGSRYEHRDVSVRYLNQQGLRSHLLERTHGSLTPFEESLVDEWGTQLDSGNQDDWVLTPLLQIGGGLVGYMHQGGGSGDRVSTLYSRSGEVIRKTHSEAALVSMGLGPFEYVLLARAAWSLGRGLSRVAARNLRNVGTRAFGKAAVEPRAVAAETATTAAPKASASPKPFAAAASPAPTVLGRTVPEALPKAAPAAGAPRMTAPSGTPPRAASGADAPGGIQSPQAPKQYYQIGEGVRRSVAARELGQPAMEAIDAKTRQPLGRIPLGQLLSPKDAIPRDPRFLEVFRGLGGGNIPGARVLPPIEVTALALGVGPSPRLTPVLLVRLLRWRAR